MWRYLYKTDIGITIHRRSAKFDSFECFAATLTSGTAVHLVVIYRPLPSKANRSSDKKFFDEFATYLESHTDTKHLVIVGNFNVHLDLPTNPATIQLRNILDDMNLVQHVLDATHIARHTLD